MRLERSLTFSGKVRIFIQNCVLMATIKATSEAMERLANYNGKNPYIHTLKRDVFVRKVKDAMNDFNIEYVNNNYNKEPRLLNRMTRVADWYGLKLKEKWMLDFVPDKLKIISYLGDTTDSYHCYVQYRQSVEPVLLFIPKKAVLKNFLLDDYHKIQVDFDRYDRLSAARRPDKPRHLQPHQKEAVQFLLSRKKCVLADDMGLGKTCEAIVAAIEGNFDCVLIICPASLKSNWFDELSYYVQEREITIVGGCDGMNKKEIEKYLGYGVGKSGKTIPELKQEAKERGKWDDNRFVIINYDILCDVYKIPETRSRENVDKALQESPMLRFIKGKKALIIIDEAHRLSKLDADRYKIVSDLVKRGNPDSLYLMTGTPITNDPQNYYNLLDFIGDPITDNWQYYMERYCGAIRIPKNDAEKAKRNRITAQYLAGKGKATWYDLTKEEKKSLSDIVERQCKMKTIPKDPTNLEELRDRTSHIYLRRLKESLKSLPNKYYHEKFYDLTPEQWAEYNRLWEEYVASKTAAQQVEPPVPDEEQEVNISVSSETQSERTAVLNKSLIEGGLYRKYLSDQMVPHTTKLTDKCLAKGEKVIIACCYDDELYSLQRYYGDRCVIYNGKMSLKEKDAAKDKFINDPKVMVFIGNIQAAGVGINLIVSRVLIFNNISFVPGDNQQMCDRCYRLGQTRDVHIFYQFFRNTQYEKMWNTVLRKSLVIDQVIKTEDEK